MDQDARIPTNLRTLMILEVLGRADHPMTATEINAHLGLPRQTVHRLCVTLERAGFLTRPGGGKLYQPARRLRELGVGLLHNSRGHMARRQILMDVARAIRETVNFVVPEEGGMSYLDRVETDWPFRIQLPIGSNVPFHCTASGKCFMASLTPKARAAFVSVLTLQQLTAKTLTSQEDLLTELAQIARQGYSLDAEEFMDGMVAAAVPVYDGQGRFVAALAVHGPVQRLTNVEDIARTGVLQDAAAKLGSALFSDDA